MSTDDNFDQQIPEFFADMSREYFEDMFNPCHNLYIDLEMLQDFRLGALLCLITTEPEYQYIQYRLKEYNDRFNLNTMEHFPVITSVTEEDITTYIDDKKNHLTLARVSPMTDLYAMMPEFLRAVRLVNLKCSSQHDLLTITLGTDSVIYDKPAKTTLINVFKKLDTRLNVDIINRPAWEMDNASILGNELFLVHDMTQFFNHKVISNYVFNSEVFTSKRILAHPVVETEDKEGHTDIQKLQATRDFLTIYCNFEYIQRGIDDPEDDDTSKEDTTTDKQ